MKQKRFLAVLLAGAMLAGSSMTVFAEEDSIFAGVEKAEENFRAAYAEEAPVIDGVIDDIWAGTDAFYSDFGYMEDMGQGYGYAKILWSEDKLYMLAVIEDATLEGIGEDSTANGANFWVSETASTETGFGNVAGDWHYFANQDGNTNYYTGNDMSEIVICATTKEDGYYIVEIEIPVQTEGLTYTEGSMIGFNLSVDDDLDGDNGRDAFCTWIDHNENAYWSDPSCLGKVELVNSIEEADAE